MVTSPELLPSYHDLFFTHYMTVLELVTFLGQFPLILLHELAHALAGRRLGLRTRLSIDRRRYYVVFVTEMDGLVTVPRRKRLKSPSRTVACFLATRLCPTSFGG